MSEYNLEDDYRKLLNIEAAKHKVEHILLWCLIVSVLGVGSLLYIQSNTTIKGQQTVIKGQEQEVKNQEQAAVSRQNFIASITKQLQEQSSQTENVVLCLGEFFAQPDRTNLTIANLQQCKINVNAFSSTTAVLPSQSSASSAPPSKEPTSSEPPKTPTAASPSNPVGVTTGPSSPSTTSHVGGGTAGESFLTRVIQGIRSIL